MVVEVVVQWVAEQQGASGTRPWAWQRHAPSNFPWGRRQLAHVLEQHTD